MLGGCGAESGNGEDLNDVRVSMRHLNPMTFHGEGEYALVCVSVSQLFSVTKIDLEWDQKA